MAELTLTTFQTLDGVMQAPGGPGEDPDGRFEHGGWLVPHADEDRGSTMVEIFSQADAFLLGRTTYDIFAGHWPRVTDAQDPIASRLNTLPKHVASRTGRRIPAADISRGVGHGQAAVRIRRRPCEPEAGQVQHDRGGNGRQCLPPRRRIANGLVHAGRRLSES